MGTLQTTSEGHVAVPRELLADTIRALRLGGDAILDRDWDCYAAFERVEAERYATETFTKTAQRLEQLLGA